MSREGALWIGGLETYMDEAFITKALQEVGEDNVVSVKVIKNKFTGEPASYGFINFSTDHNALMAMHKLNGKVIPDSSPAARFKLNHNSTRLMPGEKDFSIWVGDLTSDVDDLQLYRFFSNRYQSVKSAKVVLDATGLSKGYGFIRFANESEQQSALHSMTGTPGLGSKPLKVNKVSLQAKNKLMAQMEAQQAHKYENSMMATGANSADPSATDYSQYWQSQYGQNWSQYAAWSQYYQQIGAYDPAQANSAYYGQRPDQANAAQQPHSAEVNGVGTEQDLQSKNGKNDSKADDFGSEFFDDGERSIFEGDDFELVDHSAEVDPEVLNQKYFARTEELWDSIESSRWWKDD